MKSVRFIFGEEDACSCNDPNYSNPDFCFHSTLSCFPYYGTNQTCCDTYPDTHTDNVFDNSTAGATEGTNRLQRGINYVSYLKKFYEEYTTVSDSFAEYAFFDGGHDSAAFGSSAAFSSWAFTTSK